MDCQILMVNSLKNHYFLIKIMFFYDFRGCFLIYTCITWSLQPSRPRPWSPITSQPSPPRTSKESMRNYRIYSKRRGFLTKRLWIKRKHPERTKIDIFHAFRMLFNWNFLFFIIFSVNFPFFQKINWNIQKNPYFIKKLLKSSKRK